MKKTRILICGILPPPYFGHSMMYKMLMGSSFIEEYDVSFLNLHFWTYQKHKKVTLTKIFKMLRYLWRYSILIVSRRPKYVLYNMSFDKMPFLKDYIFCLLGRVLGCRIILHDMGQYVKELYDSSGFLHKRLIRHLLRITTASIVLGEKTRFVYEGLFDVSRVVSVPGCVEDSRLAYPAQIQQKEDDQKIKVLYFSFLAPSKGLFTALEAIPKVIVKNPNIHFMFAGPFESEPVRQQMEIFLKEHQLKSHVTYLGYVGDDRQRTDCYRNADIFIFPTLRDVFGLVILHAFAEGLPVIASVEGNIPEIVEEGRSGFLFSKGNAQSLAEKIVALAEDEKLRSAMSQEALRKYHAVYTPRQYGQRMTRAFQKIEGMEKK